MQIVRRPLAPGELDHELLWLSVSLGGLAASAVWLALHLPWPVCWFRELTGHPCATCGATRSAIAFFQGQFFNAWKWNPLAFLTYCSVAAADAYAFGVLITRGRRLRAIFSPREKQVFRISAVAVLLLNWIYLLAHAGMFMR